MVCRSATTLRLRAPGFSQICFELTCSFASATRINGGSPRAVSQRALQGVCGGGFRRSDSKDGPSPSGTTDEPSTIDATTRMSSRSVPCPMGSTTAAPNRRSEMTMLPTLRRGSTRSAPNASTAMARPAAIHGIFIMIGIRMRLTETVSHKPAAMLATRAPRATPSNVPLSACASVNMGSPLLLGECNEGAAARSIPRLVVFEAKPAASSPFGFRCRIIAFTCSIFSTIAFARGELHLVRILAQRHDGRDPRRHLANRARQSTFSAVRMLKTIESAVRCSSPRSTSGSSCGTSGSPAQNRCAEMPFLRSCRASGRRRTSRSMRAAVERAPVDLVDERSRPATIRKRAKAFR